MAYVITQNCCKDASCVPVCPVDCIRPAGGPDFVGTQMLFIDPESCIDCGACMDECPVDAIQYEEDLTPALERYKEINRAYFERHPLESDTEPARRTHSPVPRGTLRVAVVGAGPAGCYAATELIAVDGVEVDMFERLPTPFGLIRAGVAPDHLHTKKVVDIFASTFSNKRFGCHLNVEVGQHITHEDLLAHHHAVVYAVGAAQSRDLGIAGEHLPGNHAAADFVGWYNGHPDHAAGEFDLTGRRAVIVGNGNVALDIARVLLMGPDALSETDAAQHAVDALAHSAIDEVVILGRRGLRHAAFSLGEFVALGHLDDVDVVIENGDTEPDDADDVETALKLAVAREYLDRPRTAAKRIVFRFLTSPVEIVGDGAVEALKVSDDGRPDLIETSLILRSIGYRGAAVDGVPHDATNWVIPNHGGRVVDDSGAPVTGVYVTGWIKRGPRGVIGTNRVCAEETVDALLADFDAGLLTREVGDREALTGLLAGNGAQPVPWSGWRAIDTAERSRGSQTSRPRVKFVDVAEMLTTAQAPG